MLLRTPGYQSVDHFGANIGEHRKISVNGSVCLRSKGSRGSVGGSVGMGFRAMKTMGSDAASTTSKLCYLQ